MSPLTYRRLAHVLGMIICLIVYSVLAAQAHAGWFMWGAWMIGIIYGSILTNLAKGRS